MFCCFLILFCGMGINSSNREFDEGGLMSNLVDVDELITEAV